MSDGDLLFVEAPLVTCFDADNISSHCCPQCLRQLSDFKFRFASPESEELLHSMPDETLTQLKSELAAQFAPPLHITERHGFRFCSTSCADEACDAWLNVLLPFISTRDARLVNLLPSLFPGATSAQPDRERASTELLTLLIARNVNYPETWSRWVSRLAYAAYSPDQPLLDHEILQLDNLRSLFPSQLHLLSEENFKRMKSAVDLNAFSIETNQITISLGIEHAPPPVDDSPSPSGQLSVHVEVDDAAVSKGHALYRIGSFMNHSCEPNVGMVSPSFSSRAQWSLLKPARAGQELVNSYIALDDANQTRAERQHLLRLHYKFNCTCNRCVAE
eukprot:TRINITY_DN2556_c0_g1_i1.p1 TRINITY_DN2556_c0_g1~~TRINITY_DN2556_c0_g1_i1.p1  ORF type:complete len:333 (+),score=23.66 TRINITY_DN2556_c0_g1_i1:828-1826(+)